MVTPLIPKARKYTAMVEPHGLNLPGTMLVDPKKAAANPGSRKVNPEPGSAAPVVPGRESRHKRSSHLQIPGHSAGPLPL